jgi:hypothetical protein
VSLFFPGCGRPHHALDSCGVIVREEEGGLVLSQNCFDCVKKAAGSPEVLPTSASSKSDSVKIGTKAASSHAAGNFFPWIFLYIII